MLWLDRPPWGRWFAAVFLIGLAIWFESRPPPPAPVEQPAATEESPTLPPGWWAFPVEIGPGAEPGDRVLVLIVETGATVEGLVADGADDDPFGSGRGMVAVPPEHAASAAAAAANGGVVVLLSAG